MQELMTKTPVELARLAVEWRTALREKRFKVATHQLTRHQELRALRQDVARLETALRSMGKTSS